jgi:hypothetical protein
MSLIGKTTMVGDLGKGLGGSDDQMAGFLNTKVAQIFFGSHVEAAFKFS